MSEKCQSVIELHEVPAGIMDVLLDFVYTETVNVSVENVQELLPAACLLQLTGQYQRVRVKIKGQRLVVNVTVIRVFHDLMKILSSQISHFIERGIAESMFT